MVLCEYDHFRRLGTLESESCTDAGYVKVL